MDSGNLPRAKRYTDRRRWWQRWRKLVSVLGCVVVFCTTYALILPAITQERATFCGMEEHIHGEGCQTQTVLTELVCTVAEGEGHVHDENCYTLTEGHVHGEGCYELTDGHIHDENCYTLTEGHVHGEDCYELTEGHVHGESCYTLSGGHSHDESCYTSQGGHTHDDGCYEWAQSCQGAEEGHEHTEECQEQVPTLVCSQPECDPERVLTCTQAETPSEQVLTCTLAESAGEQALVCTLAETAAEQVLTCTQAEGTAEQVLVCTLEETAAEQVLTCTLAEAEPHTHGEECYETTQQEAESVCSLEEHEHSTACYSDPTADVETAATWERSFEGLELTGLWRQDVLALAETQLGYQESIRNYVVSGDETKGYTRYGAWYGDPYGDWCAMFVSFCLNYAEVEGVPLDANCQNWIETLSGEELDLYREKENYDPQPGDLVFFDWKGEGRANHVGLVTGVTEEEDGIMLTTVEGNSSNQVRNNTYSIDDDTILGYGVLPEYALEETTRTVEIYTDSSCTTLAEDETTITVSGTIPEIASIRAYAVAPETELNVLCAYEISILLPDGTVFEPASGESLNVNIQCGAIDEADTDLEVYYIPEEGEPEAVETTATDEGVAFDADHFSTYAVVAAEAEAVPAADTGETIPTSTEANAYYHSTTYPRYQRTTHRYTKGGSAYRVETYILISMDEYGGTTWTPDSTTWTAAGNHNYVVTYCADYYNTVSDTGATEYKYKYLLSNTNFTADQQDRLQCIIENSYPFISEAEMLEKLNAAGYTGTYSASAMLFAAQKAIWETADGVTISVYDQASVDNTGVLNPITSTNSAAGSTSVNQIYEYLMNVASTDPGALEITGTTWADNGDGTYTITATLNRAMIDGEEITATLSDGSHSVTKTLDAGTSQFTIYWDEALPEGGKLTLSISGSRPVMEVYYYDDGGGVQDLIGGEPGRMEEDDEIIVISSVTDVTVKKEWVGIDASAAPEITVELLKNGEVYDTITLSSTGGWSYTWTDLPASENGTAITYTAREDVPAGYTPTVSTTSQDGAVTITLTNTAVAEETKTSVAVEKVWTDGNDLHTADTVTVQLYADGVYVRQLVLNADNGWKGTFEELAYYRDDGVTPIVYTLKEVAVDGYTTEITYTDVAAESTITWTEKSSLSAGTMYRFVSGDYALAMDAAGNLVSAPVNPNDPYQWWTITTSSSWGTTYYVLQNEKTGKYIQYFDSGFAASDGYSSLRFSSKKLYYSGGWSSYYIQLTSDGVSTVTSSSSGTAFTVYQGTGTLSMPTYSATVTNTPVPVYVLPETGGIGQLPYTAGGLLLMTAACLILLYNHHKRRKEETASS